MPLDITHLGHSGFHISDGEHALIVDPFLTGNPLAVHKPADLEGHFVALTHGHADHLGDTEAIAKSNNATVYAPYEITEYLAERGVHNLEPGNPGGRIDTPFGWVAFTDAVHSSSFEGRDMGCACGLVISIGGRVIYHAGDTALFSDMKLIAELYEPSIAMLPIGDRFTMGPAHAARAAEWIKPEFAVPIHWGTFPPLVQDPAAFAPRGVQVKVMKPGESWSLG